MNKKVRAATAVVAGFAAGAVLLAMAVATLWSVLVLAWLAFVVGVG